MSPIEARYFIDSKEIESVKSERDGENVVLKTPVGDAWAKLAIRKTIRNASLGERFATQFPNEDRHTEWVSVFDFKKIRHWIDECNKPEITRKRTYQTNAGELVIELKAINSDPLKK
ncbi:MAG: hypothetical protein ABIJ05_01815 [Patescibacteria group bacterium]